MIINLQNSNAWKIQLTIAINFISSKDAEEECVMHSAGDNVKFTPYGDVNEVVDELIESLCSKYQINLETSLRRSDFIFVSIQFNFIRGGSYNDSPKKEKRKKQ